MFKKKSILPERPSPPSIEEMLEDLSFAKPDDVLLISPDSSSKVGKHVDNLSSKVLDDYNLSYLKVKTFVESCNTLEKILPNLQRENEQLKMLKNELNEELHNLKQKAADDVNLIKP
ncbi:UPF0449 protein C19orf25 homolog [Centruroides sculpturatus]|uniref:UPF0449 protein C19orf25 homolog n=1 Tax=Centruroides sculpturatus TaxID=218467 RepID=UPI000C6E54A9|nr:UPF0449 protein C19orf25 homolog [Centruroides sculpturatus]